MNERGDHARADDQARLDEFEALDDTALLSRRAEMRAELERLPPGSPGQIALTALCDLSAIIVDDRARAAWSTSR
ncbi:MAG TPA: hypothetical protein VMA73_07285 [Streptosporangiaceae bacterium]|jgi:hypothetical protein|nr:hypothetical protein [Streptosporangiaceae bacterium]